MFYDDLDTLVDEIVEYRDKLKSITLEFGDCTLDICLIFKSRNRIDIISIDFDKFLTLKTSEYPPVDST